jgi:hypothetical protein
MPSMPHNTWFSPQIERTTADGSNGPFRSNIFPFGHHIRILELLSVHAPRPAAMGLMGSWHPVPNFTPLISSLC